MNKVHTGFPPLLAAFLGLALSASEAFALDLQIPSLASSSCTGNCGVTTASGAIVGTPVPLGTTYGYVSTNTLSGTASLAIDPQKGIETNGSSILTNAFTAQSGDKISVNFNYVTTDNGSFSDYAWARVLNGNDNSVVAWLFTARSTTQGGKEIAPASLGNVFDKKYFDPKEGNGVSLSPIATFVDQAPVWAPLGGSSGECFGGTNNLNGCGFTGWMNSTYTFAGVGTGNYKLEFGVTNWNDKLFNSGLAFQYQGIAMQAPEPATFLLMGSALALFGVSSLRRRRRG